MGSVEEAMARWRTEDGGRHISAYRHEGGRSYGRGVGGLASALIWSEQQSAGPVATGDAAALACQLGSIFRWDLEDMADRSRMATVGEMVPAEWHEGQWGAVVTRWRAARQCVGLWDLDDLVAVEHSAEEVWEAVGAVVRRWPEMLSGYRAALQTGPHGLQIALGFRHGVAPGFFGENVVREWYQQVGGMFLRKLDCGGYVDMTSCAAGRFMRRPEWRVLVPREERERGVPAPCVYRARLLFVETAHRSWRPKISLQQ